MMKGDANSKFFHLVANSRKRKNFIHSLQSEEAGTVTSQEDKQKVILDHFSSHIGTYIPRNCSLNFHAQGWQPRQLQHLDSQISEAELAEVVKQISKEKALGPDGIVGLFFPSVGILSRMLCCWLLAIFSTSITRGFGC
jgi:hypothetical protein